VLKKNSYCAGFIPYGGLGNQLFQFAATLSLKTDESKDLAIDILGAATKNADGNPEILDFEIERLVKLQIRKTNQSRITRKLISTQLQISNKVFQNGSIGKMLSTFLMMYSLLTSLVVGIRVLSPNGLGWDKKLKPLKKDFTLLGNFHSYVYVTEQIRSQLRMSLQTRNNSTELAKFKDLAVSVKPTGIHIRLGDYLKLDELNVIDKEYFAKSVAIIESKNPKTNYWIFTNDSELSLTYLPPQIASRCTFIPSTLNSAQTLEIMWLCQNYIISNSTFSWWGAFLSKTENPLVIAPKNWFKTLIEPRDICPAEWIRL
jgi:hypothetical protein